QDIRWNIFSEELPYSSNLLYDELNAQGGGVFGYVPRVATLEQIQVPPDPDGWYWYSAETDFAKNALKIPGSCKKVKIRFLDVSAPTRILEEHVHDLTLARGLNTVTIIPVPDVKFHVGVCEPVRMTVHY